MRSHTRTSKHQEDLSPETRRKRQKRNNEAEDEKFFKRLKAISEKAEDVEMSKILI